MRVHGALGRLSETASLVPEWMWWAHMFLAAVAAIAMLLRFDLPIWIAFVAFVAGTATLTLGLFHRVTALIVALLGTVVVTGAAALVFGAFLSALARRAFGESDTTLYVCCALGALVGLWIAVSSYRPFILRIRRS